MNKNQFGGGNYISPQVQVLEIVPETVLCQSNKSFVTFDTGVTWSVGEDAEW